jgi:hypothetical protein
MEDFSTIAYFTQHMTLLVFQSNRVAHWTQLSTEILGTQ